MTRTARSRQLRKCAGAMLAPASVSEARQCQRSLGLGHLGSESDSESRTNSGPMAWLGYYKRKVQPAAKVHALSGVGFRKPPMRLNCGFLDSALIRYRNVCTMHRESPVSTALTGPPVVVETQGLVSVPYTRSIRVY